MYLKFSSVNMLWISMFGDSLCTIYPDGQNWGCRAMWASVADFIEWMQQSKPSVSLTLYPDIDSNGNRMFRIVMGNKSK